MCKYIDLEDFVIDFGHSKDLFECDPVSVLEPVSLVFSGVDEAVLVVADTSNDGLLDLFTCGVEDCEFLLRLYSRIRRRSPQRPSRRGRRSGRR